MKNKSAAGYKMAEKVLRNGGIGVLPTDTIYGLVGPAFSKEAVKRIFQIRKREKGKPFIILISSQEDLSLFKLHLKKQEKKILSQLWPGKISIIFSCPFKEFQYLHLGKKSLAFRVPGKKSLLSLIRRTGPLVAPSANLAGKKPAEDIREAKRYFGDKIDFYADEGKIYSPPSTLVEIINGKIEVKREGAGKINFFKK